MMTTAASPTRLRLLRGDIILISLGIHVLALALPLALLQVYDRILPGQAFGTATLLVIGVAGAIILEAFLRRGRSALFAHIGARYEAELLLRAFERVLHSDTRELARLGAPGIQESLRAVSQVRDLYSGNAAVALLEVPFVAVYIGLIYYIGGWLALIPGALFIVALTAALGLKGRTEVAAQAAEQSDAERRDFLFASFASLDAIKARGAEGVLSSHYGDLTSRHLLRATQLEFLTGAMRENGAFLGQLATVLIVLLGAPRVMDGELTTGALSACTILAGRSIGPAMAGLGYLVRLAQLGEARRKVKALLALRPATAQVPSVAGRIDGHPQATRRRPGRKRRAGDGPPRDGAAAAETPRVTAGRLTLTLNNDSHVIEAGEIVSLSSASRGLASRILEVTAGMAGHDRIRVSVDGRDLHEYPPAALREGVVLVPRQLALVPGSILNNMTLFDPRYNAATRPLAEALGLSPFLNRLRSGVLTEVGPQGLARLDEGLLQRIAIIRALVRRPRVLLLDHAGSALDLDGCQRLARVLTELRGSTTVVLASTREALLEIADRDITIGDLH